MWKRDEAVKPVSPQPAAPAAPVAPTQSAASQPEPRRIERDVVNIGKSVVIKGELNGSEDLTIEGHVEGKIELKEHVLTIERHLGAQIFDYVIYNTGAIPEMLAATYAAGGAHPIVTGSFELGALEKLGIHPIGVPLVSEHPEGKIRHHPERLAAAITALATGKLGAWRARTEAGSQ